MNETFKANAEAEDISGFEKPLIIYSI